MALVGAVTALFAATIAVGQYDIKKVLAYSTISQLGYMVAGVGMGALRRACFILSHMPSSRRCYFFQPVPSSSAWNADIITCLTTKGTTPPSKAGGHKEKHSEEVFDPGDMRNMGGLRKTMPVTFWLYLIGYAGFGGHFPVCRLLVEG